MVFSWARSVGDDLMEQVVFNAVNQQEKTSGGGAVALSGADLPAVSGAPEGEN